MNLFEISDEFNNLKGDPEKEISFIEKRRLALDHEQKHVRQYKQQLLDKIVGHIEKAAWGFNNPSDPTQKAEIDKIIAKGFVPIIQNNTWSGNDEVEMFIPNLPQNREVIEKLIRVSKRDAALAKMRDNIPSEIKRAKGRLSAWKRKQPNYVGRATGKELLGALKKQVEEYMTSKGWTFGINNSYYWAKNKMIVIDIPVRTGLENKTPIDTAKTIVKPDLTEFLESLGYTQFRVIDRYYPDSKLMIVKIQLDDVEAKNKAANNETL
ncbi:MAG: hypothetical protein KGI25_08745 [Thaumarchaeota archaeon]|nr:hypothetical protein [Nitrososphaerota archaeon]